MSSTLTDSLRSATYNPEAEKARVAEREKAQKVLDEINTYLEKSDGIYTELSSKSYTPKWTIVKLEALLKQIREWLAKNPNETEITYKNKQKEWYKAITEILTINTYLYISSAFEKIMNHTITVFLEGKKMMSAADRAKYKEWFEELKAYNKKVSADKDLKLSDLKIFFEQLNRKIEGFSKEKGIWDFQQGLLQTAIRNPDKFEADFGELEKQQEEVKKEEEKTFSGQRFLKKVSSTAGSVVASLFYVMFCITIGMMAANQAIGREPAYRVLYFIYGSIFAPVLFFYYVYLWFKGQSPKIYTLLPVTTMKAETTIGKFFLFPFAFQEDKTARDLLVGFLTESAETVGKTFDPKTLGSIGQQVESVAENLKNLTSETATNVVQELPKLNSLRVNA